MPVYRMNLSLRARGNAIRVFRHTGRGAVPWWPVVCLVLGTVGLLTSGCATSQVADAPVVSDASIVATAPEPRPLRLVPGDEVQVRFFYYPELNVAVTVRGDGRISLDLVDEVAVEGLTPAELDDRLTAQYTPHLRYPTLTVVVTEGPRHVYVGGEVRQPGALTLHRRMTLAQAIYTAGSLRDEGDVHRVVLLRETGPGLRSYRIVDLDLVQQGQAEDPALQPFDVVFVPKSSIAELNLFVEQYIDKVLPFGRSVSYNYTEVLR